MVARLVRRALLLEIAAWTLLAAWLHFARGWPLAGVGVAWVLAPFAARFAFTVFALALGRAWGTPLEPGERLGAPGLLRLVAREYRALLAFNLLDLPFERLRLRPDPEPAPLAAPAVVAIHGYGANRGSLRPLVLMLEAAGLGPVFAPNLPAAGASIEAYAQALEVEVRRVASATGRPVVIVGHSMGGLGARAYLARHGSREVAALVTLGSPHHGTRTAFLGAGPNARQMRPGSAFLQALEAGERDATPGLPATSIYSLHDDVVMPQATSELAWARNVRLAGEGHLSILDAPQSWEAVRGAVARAQGRD